MAAGGGSDDEHAKYILEQTVVDLKAGQDNPSIMRYSIWPEPDRKFVLIDVTLVVGGTEKPLTSTPSGFRETVCGAKADNGILELTVVATIKTLWAVVEEQTKALAPCRPLQTPDTQAAEAWALLERDYATRVPGRSSRQSQIALALYAVPWLIEAVRPKQKRSRRLLENLSPVAVMPKEERKSHLRGFEARYALRQVQEGLLSVERE
ncbi:hypothetical protein N657DRAFT_636982 [Parathielavia appendiculata]|uniref:Uncharacterized protein n=1 Tax=Parathielavia appendiculata TaxID=2587402 RepID=A0AAN6TSQ9_9PEZI|nr:hypothetical protein N657DRAFT_636982 [Parathielavia appendiculata]